METYRRNLRRIALTCFAVAIVLAVSLCNIAAASGFYADAGLGWIANNKLEVEPRKGTGGSDIDMGKTAAAIFEIGYQARYWRAGYFHLSLPETDRDPGLDVFFFRVRFN